MNGRDFSILLPTAEKTTVARLIAIEGIDGSGKGTQAARLHQALSARGSRSALLSFPRYQATNFGRQIGAFLNGAFGPLDQVHPILVSLLFAGDRFESRPLIQAALDEHDLVICDRYVASNIAHQAAKAPSGEQAAVEDWIETIEYDLYQLPRPDLVLWFDLPVPQAQALIARKAPRDYTAQAADLQEADGAYLERVRQVYSRLATDNPHWVRIAVTEGENVRPIEAVHTDVVAALDQRSWI